MLVGMDLGTANSLVGVFRGGDVQLVPNALGAVLTPSCVSLDEDGSVLVGQAALVRRLAGRGKPMDIGCAGQKMDGIRTSRATTP